MSLSDESLEERISQLEYSRNFWKWLALAQLLHLAIVIAGGIMTSGLSAARARRAAMIALEEAHRTQEAAEQARQQAEEAARAAEAESTAREKDRK